MSKKIKLGQHGERIAVRYLRWRLYHIITTNYRTPYGEIDIICRRGGVIVFVEVKTRTSARYGAPELAVTPSKLLHLTRAAQYFLHKKNLEGKPWRVDVIAVSLFDRQTIKHYRNITGA